MKTVILSAGQGSRLLPLTENVPKCLLPIGPHTLLERQLQALRACAVTEAVVVTGFNTGAVERCVAQLRWDGFTARCLFNPFYNAADNLASCWMARHEMDGDFILLNGDTLFEPSVCDRLLAAPAAPVTLAIDRKAQYDSDDMKVRLDGTRLLEVDKTLADPHGESIGMLRFQGEGSSLFVDTLEQMMRTPNCLHWWYLRVIGVLAEKGVVETQSIEGSRWTEVDFPHDLHFARRLFAGQPPPAVAGVVSANIRSLR
jgi:choline kinase